MGLQRRKERLSGVEKTKEDKRHVIMAGDVVESACKVYSVYMDVTKEETACKRLCHGAGDTHSVLR